MELGDQLDNGTIQNLRKLAAPTPIDSARFRAALQIMTSFLGMPGCRFNFSSDEADRREAWKRAFDWVDSGMKVNNETHVELS